MAAHPTLFNDQGRPPGKRSTLEAKLVKALADHERIEGKLARISAKWAKSRLRVRKLQAKLDRQFAERARNATDTEYDADDFNDKV